MRTIVSLKFRGKTVSLPVRRTGFLRRGFGLMFRTSFTENLLFEFNAPRRYPFTAFCVFFPFLMIWLDDKNSVLGARVVKPFEWSIKPTFSFTKVVEIPVNERNRELVAFFVGK